MNLCDMCGKPIKAGTSLGGALVCRLCAVDLRDEMDQMQADGKSVDGLKIARQILRETYSDGTLMIKDFPNDLLVRVIDRAHEEGDCRRDFIVKYLYALLCETEKKGNNQKGKW
ncbi:hypothetical protein ES703_52047 [subsurface metagenome]